MGATVDIHPMFVCGDIRFNDYGMINAVWRGTDTTTAVTWMLFVGHFTRFAGLQCAVSHGVGAIPYMLGRLRRNQLIHPDECAHWNAEFEKLYFDSVLFDPDALTSLCFCCGYDKVMLGSGHPFVIGDMETLKVVEDGGFDDAQNQMTLAETAKHLFPNILGWMRMVLP